MTLFQQKKYSHYKIVSTVKRNWYLLMDFFKIQLNASKLQCN